MILFEEALAIVHKSGSRLPAENIPFLQALGRVLAENVLSDIDMPPFDKSAMDGFACRKEDLPDPFTVLETIPAGRSPQYTVGKSQCARIMTGSQLPQGADCVIKVEETETTAEGTILFKGEFTANHICYQAEDLRSGQVVLQSGELLSPAHIALLASVGHTMVSVSRKVKIAVLASGDELVEPAVKPAPSQIRNSNASQMITQAAALGCEVHYYGIAPDEENALLALIHSAMTGNDILLLSGGVSMGDYDLVPPMLQKAGFDILFNRIAVMPGSPTLFAKNNNTWCFGLPGNPVSSFVQFELLVKPLVYQLMGHVWNPFIARLTMGAAWSRRNAARKSLVPVKFNEKGEIIPLEYHGSAHIHAYMEAMGMLIVPIGQYELKPGDQADVRFL